MNGQLQCLAPTGDRCGEGAVWDPNSASLYWTDINRFLIHRYVPSTGNVSSWFFEEPVVALSLTEAEDIILVALGSGIILWRPANDERWAHPFSLPGWPAFRLNDGRADPRGDFWVGFMRNNVGPEGEVLPIDDRSDGEMLCVSANGKSRVLKSHIGVPNTVDWSPDQRYFYFGDTLQNTIWRYEYDAETGLIRNETDFFSGFERGLPDGSTVDADGYLWNCRWGGSCVVRVAPDGTVDRVVELPVTNVTTCVFGGPTDQTLFITTAGAQEDPHRLAGGLFAIESGVRGMDSYRAKLP